MAIQIELTPMERMAVLLSLSKKKQGNYSVFQLMDTVAEACSFLDPEIKALQLVISDGQVTVPPGSAHIVKQVEIPDVVAGIIQADLQDMNDKDILPRTSVTLFKKMCLPQQEGTSNED